MLPRRAMDGTRQMCRQIQIIIYFHGEVGIKSGAAWHRQISCLKRNGRGMDILYQSFGAYIHRCVKLLCNTHTHIHIAKAAALVRFGATARIQRLDSAATRVFFFVLLCHNRLPAASLHLSHTPVYSRVRTANHR